MKSALVVTLALAGAVPAGTAASAQTAAPSLRLCTARVVYSEELPFAPINTWLVNVTLEVTPGNGAPYYTTLHNHMPWQGPPPRRGQAFRLWCDPLHPSELRAGSRPLAAASF